MTLNIETPNGRRSGLRAGAAAGGVPVISHHGTPMCRLDLPGSVPTCSTLSGVDLIMFDRAGYGRSCRLPGRTVAAAAADIAQRSQMRSGSIGSPFTECRAEARTRWRARRSSRAG